MSRRRQRAERGSLRPVDEIVTGTVSDPGREAEAFEVLDEVPSVEGSTELTNVLRPDVAHESLTHEAVLANAPETEAGRFKGPNVS